MSTEPTTDTPTPSGPAPTGVPVITVWRFDDAPPEYRALSPHGGDEDWLALVPRALTLYPADWPPEDSYDLPGWMREGGAFGCCDVSVHPLDGADACIAIGAHA